MKIIFSEIINQTRQILIHPKKFWLVKKEESETAGNVFTNFLLPIIFTVAIAVFIGDLFRRNDFIIETFTKFRTNNCLVHITICSFCLSYE